MTVEVIARAILDGKVEDGRDQLPAEEYEAVEEFSGEYDTERRFVDKKDV